jgi:hypothetical protein
MTWFLLLPFWLVMQILAYLLAPVLPLFAESRWGSVENNNEKALGYRLPLWLAWFDTPDNRLEGDAGHRERTAGDSLYYAMVLWLWRNPATGFDASVLSAVLDPLAQVVVIGDPQVQDAPHGKEGYCYTTYCDYWNLVYIKKISTTRCIKLDLGWQLKTFAEGHPLTPSARYAMSIRFPEFKTA